MATIDDFDKTEREARREDSRPNDRRMTKGERLLKNAEEAIGDSMRRAHETGELRHLYGRPLDLSDTSPDWLANRILKRAGLSHPTLERGKDFDDARRAAENRLVELRRLRDRLTEGSHSYTPQQADAFNTIRLRTLDRYRDELTAVGRMIRDWNLTVPELLQRRGLIVDDAVKQAEKDIPPVDIVAPKKDRTGKRTRKR